MAEQKSNLLKISGMWKHTREDGSHYYRGTLGTLVVLMFPNDYKDVTRPNEPDYTLFLAARTAQPTPPRTSRPTRPAAIRKRWADQTAVHTREPLYAA